MIPPTIKELTDKRDLKGLHNIIFSSKNDEEIAWAKFGLAECWRVGGQNFKPDKARALVYCEEVISRRSILPIHLSALTMACKADCIRVGDINVKRNIKAAYKVYLKLLKLNQLSAGFRARLLCGKADCLRSNLISVPGNIKEAYDVFEDLLKNHSQLQPSIKLRAIMGKAECLMRGDVDFSSQVKEAYEIYCSISLPTANPIADLWITYFKAHCLYNMATESGAEVKQSWELCNSILSHQEIPPAIEKAVKDCINQCLSRLPNLAITTQASPVGSTFARVQDKLNEVTSDNSKPMTQNLALSVEKNTTRTVKKRTIELSPVSSQEIPVPLTSKPRVSASTEPTLSSEKNPLTAGSFIAPLSETKKEKEMLKKAAARRTTLSKSKYPPLQFASTPHSSYSPK